MVRDNVLIPFLKLEIFLKNLEGSQILQEIHSMCTQINGCDSYNFLSGCDSYNFLRSACPPLSFSVYRMQIFKGRGILSAAGLCV